MNGARISKAAVLASALMATYASAIGLGEAKLKSWLGQPLDVTVALTDTQDLSADDILVRQIHGLNAQQLKLQDAIHNPRYLISTETDAQSNIWVNVSTRNPISEPYVSFVLQVEMPGGSVSREYTLLIDMPPSGAEDSANYARNHNSNEKSNNKSTATTELRNTTNKLSNTYTVQKGDTLGQVAQKVRPDESIRLKAIIKRLYEHNRSAFEGGDINNLILGAALQLPSPDEYAAMPKRQHLTPAKQQVRNSAIPKLSNTIEQHLYSTYTVKPGDTLSQVADVIRPSKRIPLNAATQTLINHNVTAVGDFGGRLSIGQLLRIPPDDTFYLEAGLPIAPVNQNIRPPQTATSKSPPSEPEFSAEQRDNRSQEDFRPSASDELPDDSQQLQSALKTINEQVQELQGHPPELLLKIDQLMALQQEQVAMTRRLVNAQRTASAESNLAKKVIPANRATQTEAAIRSAPVHLYWLIAVLSLLVVGLSAKLYWLLNIKRDSYTPAQAEPEKDSVENDTTVEQSPDTDSENHKKDSLEPVSELDLDLDLELDLDDALMPEAPAYRPYTAGRKSRITQGESAESEQHDKDQKLHQKLAERNLEASNTPAFDNNFIDSAPVNLDEIFQPGDDDSITALRNAHHHVQNDLESDVIWQANIYSAYGQHSRAESLLNEGLHSNPKSIALKLALLDIYARSQQHEQFELLCAAIPQDDPSVKISIQQWREEFNIPDSGDAARM